MPPDERDGLDSAWAFTKAAGSGVKEGAVSMAEGLWGLAKGGYHVATDPQARAQAWDTTKKIADAAKQYGQQAWNDPGKAYGDARDKVQQLKNTYDAAYAKAEANGTLPEFLGKGIGRGAFEVGTFAVGAGEVGLVGKAGEAAEIAGDLSKAARVTEEVGEAASAGGKAAEALENPALRAANKPASAVVDCPYKSLGLAPALEERIANFSEGLGQLSVETEKDQLLLYSGIGSIPGAEVTKTANAIIDRTEAGVALNNFTTELGEAGLNRNQIFTITEPMWRETSVRLASEASGKVTAVTGPTLRENAVIFDELKALSTNPKVTSVEILKLNDIGQVVSREFR